LLNSSFLELRVSPGVCLDPAGATLQQQESTVRGAEQQALLEHVRRLFAEAGLAVVNNAAAVATTAKRLIQGDVAR
jgi:hypothetical protein